MEDISRLIKQRSTFRYERLEELSTESEQSSWERESRELELVLLCAAVFSVLYCGEPACIEAAAE